MNETCVRDKGRCRWRMHADVAHKPYLRVTFRQAAKFSRLILLAVKQVRNEGMQPTIAVDDEKCAASIFAYA
jgi:hypothetical protein